MFYDIYVLHLCISFDNIILTNEHNQISIQEGNKMMDARKLDMIFFMTFENGKDLTYEEIEDIAKKYSARSLWYLWQHTKRHSKWLSRSK